MPVRIAHVEGDDVLARAAELGLDDHRDGLVAANVYLGAFGIAECLCAGADVVVTGRVTDASLVVGPAVAHFGWTPDDLDRLAGATVAGHVLECGAQATGGNFAFFTEILTAGGDRTPGFPLAEIHADGSSVITKHPGTGGAVTVETVTAQLLYEIDGPRYAGPDVTTRFDTIALHPDGPDRVRISAVRGEPPPPTAKVCRNAVGGWRNEVTFVLTGLEVEAKAALAEAQFRDALGTLPADLHVELARTDHADAATEAAASALLRITARDPNRAVVGKAFSLAAVELGLASYPGFTLTAPPADASVYWVYTSSFVDQSTVDHVSVLPDGTRRAIPPPARTAATPSEADLAGPPAPLDPAPTVRAPLGRVAGARSGDKGGTANIGVWARKRGGLAVAGALPHRGHRSPPAAGGRSAAGHRAPAGQPPCGQRGHRGHPRRGRRRVDPVRPAGQGPRRMAAQPARRRPGGAVVSQLSSTVDSSTVDFQENRRSMLDALDALAAEHGKALAGGGGRYVERHRRRGKLLPRERVELLIDRDSAFLELSTLAAWGTDFAVGASLVSGIGVISGVECVIVANDPTVRGGASNPYTLRKSLRAHEIAEQNRVPLVCLVESGGADLPTQSELFIPGGRIFRDLTRLSAAGIPTVTVVFGSSTAGGAYLPGMSDHVVMVRNRAKVFLGGPPLVRMATGEEADEEELGGAEMHARTSGLADHLAEDEADALRIGRRIVARLNHRRLGPAPLAAVPPVHDTDDLLGLVPTDPKVPFDPREVLARLLDGSEFDEFKAEYGTSMVTGWGRLHGYPIGVLANARGVLFSAESQKAAQFIQLANSAATPLLFLQNTTGYMVGASYEQAGIVKHGAMMINAVSNSRVPHLTVVMGASYGAGNYGMCGRAYGPRFLFTWPNARSAVMGPAAARGRALDSGPAGRRGEGRTLRRGGRRGDAREHRGPDRGAVAGPVPVRPALRRRRDRPAGHPHRARNLPVGDPQPDRRGRAPLRRVPDVAARMWTR